MRDAMIRYILIAWCVASLGGCAALSEEECRSANWYALGDTDGSRGANPNHKLERYHEACTKIGITPQVDPYIAGWKQGVARYCTPDNAYAAGRAGQTYHGVCTGDADRLFRINYGYGYRIYEIRRRIADIEEEIRQREIKLQEAPRKDDPKSQGKGELTKDQRRILIEQIKRLGDELPQRRWELRDAESVPVIRR